MLMIVSHNKLVNFSFICNSKYFKMKTKSIITFLLACLLLIACANTNHGEKKRFEGRLIYKISSDKRDFDENDSTSYQVIYAKDSLVRTDNFTPLGKQIYIKHIAKNRAYTLLNFAGNKMAIQSIPDSSKSIDGKYQFNYKRKKKSFLNKKAKLVEVTNTEVEQEFDVYYFEDISHDYSNAIPGVKGLPVEYSLFVNGEKLTYTLIALENKEMDKDYFGLPSDYTIITPDEFSKFISPEDDAK